MTSTGRSTIRRPVPSFEPNSNERSGEEPDKAELLEVLARCR